MILIYTKKKTDVSNSTLWETEVSAIAFVYIFISLVFMTQQRRGIEKESIRQNWTISCVVTHTNKVVVPYISMWVPTHFSLLCNLLVEACEVGPLTHPRCHFHPLVTITSKNICINRRSRIGIGYSSFLVSFRLVNMISHLLRKLSCVQT